MALSSQRLDAWLWCARVLRQRSQCTGLAAAGGIRVNRRPTDKPHAAIRPGDVLTLPVGGRVRVLEVLALAVRRGPPAEARLLYREVPEPGTSCPETAPAAYPAAPATGAGAETGSR